MRKAARTGGTSVPTSLNLILAVALPLSPLWAQEVVTLPIEDQHLRFELEPLFVVGELDGPAWAQFQDLTDAAFAADGTLFLLDSGTPTVVAVSDEGALRFHVGGRGEGPGEYRSPQSVDVLPNGTVAVFDAAKRAFLLFAADGAHLDEVRPDLTLGVPGRPMKVAADGTLLALPERIVTGSLGAAMLTGAGIRRIDTDIPLLRIHLSNDGAASVVARIPVAPKLADATSVIRAFAPDPSFGLVEGDGIAILTAEEYRIEVLSLDGSPYSVIQRGLSVRPTSATDRSSFLQQLNGDSREGGSIGQQGGQGSRRRPPAPWFYPTISPAVRIETDGDRSIWVQRSASADATTPGPIDLLSAEGTYRGTIPPSDRGLPVAFGPGGLVVFFEIGEYDVPTANVYRLPEAYR